MRGWADTYIEKLKKCETVHFRPRGKSMEGKINSGQLCTVVPVKPEMLVVGAIVLCKFNHSQFLHLIKEIKDGKYLIANNKGWINGWVYKETIYGVCINVK